MTRSKRMNREERQEILARRRRTQNALVYGGGVALAALLIFIVYLGVRPARPVGQEQILATQGNAHIQDGTRSPVAYNSTPPSSGPHYPGIAPWGVYSRPFPYELLVHNMEDGGVVIYYQCADGCPELVEELTSVVQPYVSQGRRLLLVPNDPTWTNSSSALWHQDMGARIALTAWQRMDKFDEFDPERIRQFIDAYEGIDNHPRSG